MKPIDAYHQLQLAIDQLARVNVNDMTFADRLVIREGVTALLQKNGIETTLRVFRNKLAENQKIGAYLRVAQLTVEAGLDLIEKSRGQQSIVFGGNKIKFSSLRLRMFLQKGVQCSCGLMGEFFAVERQSLNSNYHVNLYAINPKNGTEVMMTHDHILARCLGGADDMDNVQPMCSPCNAKKARIEGNMLKTGSKKSYAEVVATYGA